MNVNDGIIDGQLMLVGMLDIKGKDQIRRVYDVEGISPTLTAVGGENTHVKIFDPTEYRVRRLTPTEYGRLQAFPMDEWEQVVSDTQAYKQFGNSVTVNIVEAIARNIKKTLEKPKTPESAETYIARGIREDTGKMAEGYFLKLKNQQPDGDDLFIIVSENGEYNRIIPETFERCTGLKDHNNNFIFEGDIVLYGGSKHKVVFETRNRSAYFGIKISEQGTQDFGNYAPSCVMEIIGNIHESKE